LRGACLRHALKCIDQPNEHIMTSNPKHFDIRIAIQK